MDGQTGSGGIRRTAHPATPRRSRGGPPHDRPRRGSPLAGSLSTTVLLPLLPTVLLLAVASVAVSSHALLLPAADGAASPLGSALAEPTQGLVVLAGLLLASALVGLPVSVHAGLLVGGGALLGRRVGARTAWSRALRRVPTTLVLLLAPAATAAVLVRGLSRIAAEGVWSAPAAAAAAALAVLPLLLVALLLGVLADLAPVRALAEAWRTVRDRSAARLAARVRAALPSPRPGDAHGIPAAVPAVVCVLALLPLAAPGLLRPVPADPPPATAAALTASVESRATVQIEDEDGTSHLFEVGPGGLREADCGPGCVTGPAEPDRDAHVDADGSHARVGGQVVAAYWRTDPDHGPSTLYLRVCDADSVCSDDTTAAPAASDGAAPGALVGSRVEVLRNGSARVFGCTDPCAVDDGRETADAERADGAPGSPHPATAAGLPANRAGVVTVEVSGPETLRLVMLSCEPSGPGTDCGTEV
ncbi:hypothetical protein Q8791_30330 [Nocardiopsis sp. CT-R113]|uniref:Uncharacterized protein n=1 Tax=Nocardiopsis codii TaxID=3065942 RepID=A0ABU7KHQ1_9ACTN|nr:hypothetical protein [Nocardiopsis sp. CT-R113]MEE2041527.1 hypothetical protein [Nocardiopsis sp. CT-R113]